MGEIPVSITPVEDRFKSWDAGALKQSLHHRWILNILVIPSR